jgi:hypothetical protein
MGKEFRHETPLAAPPERVAHLLTDPGSLAQCYESAGFTDVAVAAHPDGDSLVVETDQHMTGPLPGPLAKLTGGTVHLKESYTWHPAGDDGRRSAAWHVDFRGVPGSIDGTTEVVPDGAGSRLVYAATVTARIPLIGGRIESMTVEQTVDKLKTEGRWLAEHV